MHEPQLSAFSYFPYDIQEYHLLFSFEQRMNLKLSFLIKTSQKMQTVVHFRYPRVVKWQICVLHVLIPNLLWFCISLHPPITICLSVSLFICLSVICIFYLEEKWGRSYWMLKSSWPGDSKLTLPRKRHGLTGKHC